MKYSVLLPTRNGAAYLKNCIGSVINQHYEDYELIISDNANTDGTSGILDSYKENPRLKTLKQKKFYPLPRIGIVRSKQPKGNTSS